MYRGHLWRRVVKVRLTGLEKKKKNKPHQRVVISCYNRTSVKAESGHESRPIEIPVQRYVEAMNTTTAVCHFFTYLWGVSPQRRPEGSAETIRCERRLAHSPAESPPPSGSSRRSSRSRRQAGIKDADAAVNLTVGSTSTAASTPSSPGRVAARAFRGSNRSLDK